ncbi:rubrerythrin family protein [Oleispirillum naphthae]|uniref:rubrerythrin family protein n=1 Tax=Oleispirillum naphthae TaxID=2838853 RepID=UPI0030825ADF
MSTIKNLQEAFAGESQANRRYLAYAEQADAEGLPGVARLLRGVAAAETIHALTHLKAMNGVKDTAANLAEALSGEEHEFAEMYPPMVAEAEAEGQKRAARSMGNAMQVEKIHFGLFGKAAEAVKAGHDLEAPEVRICPVCGHTVIGDAPDACPVCGCGGARYELVA